MMQARTTGARTHPHPRNPTRPTASYPKAGGVDRRKTQRDRPPAARARAAERAAESGGPPEERAPTQVENAQRGDGGPAPHTPWVGGGPTLRQPGRKTPSPTGSASLRHAPAPAYGERPKSWSHRNRIRTMVNGFSRTFTPFETQRSTIVCVCCFCFNMYLAHTHPLA